MNGYVIIEGKVLSYEEALRIAGENWKKKKEKKQSSLSHVIETFGDS